MKNKVDKYAGMDVMTAEVVRSNKFAVTAHLIEASIISVAYMLEFVKGARTLSYVLLTIALGLIIPIVEQIIFRKDATSKLIKHLVSYGFGLFYIFICLTTNNKLAFIYVIPMLVVVTAFNDYKYVAKVALSAELVNIVQVVYFLKTGVYTAADSAMIEIQLLGMLLVALYTIFAAKTIFLNSQMKVDEIERQSEESEQTLQNTLSVSADMTANIDAVSEEIQALTESVNLTKEAMNEVDSGSTDTSDAIQRQLEMTENIQTKVSDVKNRAEDIIASIAEANQAIAVGSKNIDSLVEQVEESVEAGKEVKDKLEELCANMEHMTSVVEIINGITSQTSLLALNASIEAARAGEAGRGFAVVASEISKMASETDEATAQIHDMLQNFSETINEVVEVTNGMVAMIEGQHQATSNTAKSFDDIERSTGKMSAHSRELEDNVDELTVANTEIVDSISTISAISEEVASHANNTLEISEQNIKVASRVAEYTARLKELADQL